MTPKDAANSLLYNTATGTYPDDVEVWFHLGDLLFVDYSGDVADRFPLDLVSRCLRTAPRQPQYRRGREHEAFVANLPVDPAMVRGAREQDVV